VKRWFLGTAMLLGTASAAEALPPPPFQRVFIVVLENTTYAEALAQPFLGALAASGALFTNFFAETHPSFPNYVALTAGSTFGLSSNDDVTLDVPHVGDLLERTGRTWKVYAEGYPGHCFLGSSAGAYVRRHVPFVSFRSVQVNPARCQQIVDASVLADDIANGTLPHYALYVPDLNNDGHDTGVAFADHWLATVFGPRLADPRFTDGLLFVVTFDEALDASNRVYTVLWGPGVVPGTTPASRHDHVSLLRTIEDAFGLGTLGQLDATAASITGVWRPTNIQLGAPGDTPVPARYDSDRLTDFAVYRPGTGEWSVLSSVTGLHTSVFGAPEASSLGDTPVPADFDGDGKADLAIYRRATGQWFVFGSAGGLASTTFGAPAAGGLGDTPVPADFDGDGRADLAVYRRATGEWFVFGSATGFRTVAFGAPAASGLGDTPVPADFDGDGKADLAVYRQATGEWLIFGSATGFRTVAFGAPAGSGLGDVPVPADYDGDGKTDLGIYRQATGEWFIFGSATGLQTFSFGAPAASGLGDFPVKGDFDGDGKADLAIYRRSTGQWFVR
jgi:Phosphoesterase family/FG-GAP-like repeat